MRRVLLFALALLALVITGVQCKGGGSSGASVQDGGAADGPITMMAPPPTFGGVATATDLDESHAALTWQEATDPATAPGRIVYRVYAGTAAGAENFAQPLVTTPAGAKGATLEGLHPATTYFFVVRAVGADGSEDNNHVEASATTTDTTAPAFRGAQTIMAVDRGTLLVAWQPATDLGYPSAAITYDVYTSTVQGGENFATPTATTAPGATQVTLTGLTGGTTYFIVVRAVDPSGNEDTNRHELSDATVDTTPPSFGGATTASANGIIISVTWSTATDDSTPPSLITYDVYMATAPGGEDFTTPSFTTVAGATSLTVTRLTPVTTYYFIVRAVDASGNEDANAHEVSATTAKSGNTTPPTFAGATSAQGTTDATIAVTWSPATDDDTAQADIVYDLFVASRPGTEAFGAPSYTTAPGAASFTIAGLAPLETVYVVVRARDQSGNEDTNTVEKSATTLADTTPPTFGGLTSATAVGAESVELQWHAASDDASPASQITYRIYQGTSAGAEGASPVTTTTGGATSVVINDLAPSTTYYFYARAVDGAGNADTTNPPVELSATTPSDTTPPTFAGIATLVATGPSTLSAGWAPATDDVSPSGAIVYLVYVSTSSGSVLSAAPVATAPGATTATLQGLTPGQTYDVIVRAEDGAGNIDGNTTILSATTPGDTTAPTFAGAALASRGGGTATSLTVTWAAASDDVTPAANIRYLVCETTTAGGCSGTSFATTVTVTGSLSTTFTGLGVNSTYYFVVRAEDAAGNIDGNSVQVMGVTSSDTTPPEFTSGEGLTATALADSSIRLSWNAATDDVSPQSSIVYDVFQGTTPGGESATAAYSSTAGATTYTIPQQYPPLLQPSTPYYFYVRPRDQAGNEDATIKNEATATTLADTTAPTFSGASGITANSTTQLTVTWSAASDDITAPAAMVYLVCWSTSSTACTTAFTAKATTGAGALTYAITGLSPGMTYFVVVRAQDQAHNVDGNIAVQSKATLSPPTVPGSFTATYDANFPRSLDLSWTPSTDATPGAVVTYQACVQATGDCTTAALSLVPTGTTTLKSFIGVQGTNTNGSALASNTSYTVGLRATDQSANASAWTYSTTPTAVSYANDVDQIFFATDTQAIMGRSNCNGCHGQSGLVGPWSYAFFQQNPTAVNYCGGTPNYIVAGSASGSFLYQMVASSSNICQLQMPYLGETSNPQNLPEDGTTFAQDIDTIGNWINQGALNN